MYDNCRLFQSSRYFPFQMLISLGRDTIKRLLQFPRTQKTLKKSEVPLLFHEPGIETGYRPPNKPWTYYFISAFQLHNESMNIWTHLIGFFVVGAAMVYYHQKLNFLSAQLYPMVIFGLTCLAFSLLSTAAHLLEAKSFFVHHFAYFLDYAGVGLYGFGTMTILSYYSADKRILQFFGAYFTPVNAIMAVTSCFCSCYGKLSYMRPYPIQRKLLNIVGNAVHLVLFAGPVFCRMFTEDASQTDQVRAIAFNKHLSCLLTFVIAVTFFATHLPEKWCPGKFDIFGYSHAFFHISVIITVLLQFDAAAYELGTRDMGETFKWLTEPLSLFVYLMAVLVADAAIIISFHGKAKEIAEKYEKQIS
ncbi:membrane progestin receptor beta-like [Lineus longissimus]|uniref:membrane progestin receptor beta-like n=1 Tax=Lineus longissimus TaxID=88925 RepID=UPI00315D1430